MAGQASKLHLLCQEGLPPPLSPGEGVRRSRKPFIRLQRASKEMPWGALVIAESTSLPLGSQKSAPCTRATVQQLAHGKKV